MDINDYVRAGKEMGLMGEALVEYVERKEKEKYDRDERAHEREMERLRLQDRDHNSHPTGHAQGQARKPRLPTYDPQTEDIDNYIRRFERFAETQKWPDDEWASNLSALLTGESLRVYSALSSAEAADYQELKTALLRRFEYTAEGFRKKFREAKPERGETFQQFGVRIESLLSRWMDMSRVEATFEGLKDLMLREQLFRASPKDLGVFLMERRPKKVKEMVELADAYAEAHPRQGDHQPSSKPDERRTTDPSRDAKGKPEPKRCFLCERVGHLARDCRVKGLRQTEGAYRQRANYCHGYSSFEGPRRPQLFTCVTRTEQGSMPVVEGVVNGKRANILRDTGSSSIVVAKKYVREEEYTGQVEHCVMADGSTRRLPLAHVKISSPYYCGETVAMVVTKPACDVLIGNVQSARRPQEPDLNWKRTRQGYNQVHAVTTRGMKEHPNRPFRALRVPEGEVLGITAPKMKQYQERDEGLAKLFHLAEKGQRRQTAGGSVRYTMKQGLLYRVYEGKYQESVQLVVPQPFRNRIMEMAHESTIAGHLGAKKIVGKIMSRYFWPGIQSEVRRFCAACDVCQRMRVRGGNTNLPKNFVWRNGPGVMKRKDRFHSDPRPTDRPYEERPTELDRAVNCVRKGTADFRRQDAKRTHPQADRFQQTFYA